MRISLAEAGKRLLDAKNIIITAHVNPDGDAIGSSLGLMHGLQAAGRTAQVILDDDIPAAFSVLPGYESIQPIEENQVPECDLLVVLDTSNDRLGRVFDTVKRKFVLNIDHHISNDDQAEFLYLDPKSAATAEIICQLFKQLKWSFSLSAAMCLYTGIATDCGFFRYSNTTPMTMSLAAELLEAGVKPNIISEALEQKSYSLVQAMAAAMQTIELSSQGRVAGIFLNQALTASMDSTEGFIDMVRVIEGVDVAVLLKCVEDKVCRVSMRSKGVDVSRIAMQFGGGGHIRAAGCTMHMSFEESKQQILSAIDKAVEEKI